MYFLSEFRVQRFLFFENIRRSFCSGHTIIFATRVYIVKWADHLLSIYRETHPAYSLGVWRVRRGWWWWPKGCRHCKSRLWRPPATASPVRLVHCCHETQNFDNLNVCLLEFVKKIMKKKKTKSFYFVLVIVVLSEECSSLWLY